jgi:hypothetical protein
MPGRVFTLKALQGLTPEQFFNSLVKATSFSISSRLAGERIASATSRRASMRIGQR